ncbi:MAG: hypothetical protein LQ349_009730, partial [Xanthoria aureola]
MARLFTKKAAYHCDKGKGADCRKGEHPITRATYCTKHYYCCSAENCTWTPLQGKECARHPEANPEQAPPAARKAAIVANKCTKRMTHHCPGLGKGNCRKIKHPTMAHMYCTKHQFYCPVDLCTFTPIQGQPCPKHGDPAQRIAY